MFEKRKDNYIKIDTKLPQYIPLPQFLLTMKLSQTAKLLYGILLSRTTLSQKNNMTDDSGHASVIYPINHLAYDMNRTEMTIKNALLELVEADLLKKKRQGFGTPNHLYVLLPDQVIRKQKENIPAEKQSVLGKENTTYNSKNANSITDSKLSTNYYSKTNNKAISYDYAEGESL
ncbi:MAG: replication initiator protein A [bacterium]|nr:replication initiator protein A [bacterium]